MKNRPRSRALRRTAGDLKGTVKTRMVDGVLPVAHLLTGRDFVPVDYPTSASNRPRYGYGRPPHEALRSDFARRTETFLRTLRTVSSYTEDLRHIPVRSIDRFEPSWVNGWLPGLDSAALYSFLRSRTPRRYVEIGSGNSTLFAARAKRDGSLDTSFTSIDPHPRAEIDVLCEEVIRTPLESADLGAFHRLAAGDVVFFDGSHRVFMNSDVAVFFLDVLPSLPAGVLVGIHDIYLPDDYPPDISPSFYSEQYVLASYLLGAGDALEVVLPATYVSRAPAYAEQIRDLWSSPDFDGVETHGCAFWFTTMG